MTDILTVMLPTHPPVHCKPCCQHFLLPWSDTRRGERRSERQSSSAASRFSWCPGSVGWSRGKALQSDCLTNAARPDTPHRWQEIQVKAVHGGVLGKDGVGGKKLHHQESNEMRQAVISRKKLSKTFPSCTRRLAGSSLGKNVQTHVLAECFLCGAVAHVIGVWQGAVEKAEWEDVGE